MLSQWTKIFQLQWNLALCSNKQANKIELSGKKEKKLCNYNS